LGDNTLIERRESRTWGRFAWKWGTKVQGKRNAEEDAIDCLRGVTNQEKQIEGSKKEGMFGVEKT